MSFISIKKITFFRIFSLSIFLLSFNLFSEVALSIYPTPVVAGEESSLIINSSGGKAEIYSLPKIKGFQWLKRDVYSRNFMIVNGVKYIKTSYPFIVKKPGRINIPSMTVSVKGEKDVTTAKKEILVSTGPLTDLGSLLFLECKYTQKNNEYYVGERIPLKINVYRALDLNADPSEYPRIKIDNVIFDSFKENPQADKFKPYPYGNPKKVTRNGIDYMQTTFYTSFRSLGEGDLQGIASLTFNIELKNHKRDRGSSSFDDDFGTNFMFGSPFFNRNKVVTRIITAKTPVIKIKPLPPVPYGSKYLGLIGDWKIEEKVQYEKLKEGEPITISLHLVGYGSVETLDVPEISVPGFNAYSPEIIKDDRGYGKKQDIKIDYVLIPTEPGKTNLNLSFSVFESQTSKYRTVNIKKEFDIHQGDGDSLKSNYSSRSASLSKRKNRINSSILYLKMNPGPSLELPLYKNHLFAMLFLLIMGPIGWILFELFYFRKKYITGRKGFKRRNTALKKKKKILKSVEKTQNVKELADYVRQEVIPYINDVNGYPPGTTAEGLELKLNNKELSDPIMDTEASAYLPLDARNSDELRKRIIKIIKHFSMLTIVCTILLFTSNNTFGDSVKALNGNVNELAEFYNSGAISKALGVCKKEISLSEANPDWIYNLGNCYFQKGVYAKAMVCYERALRLSPRDSDILENLNFVRRKLHLQDVYQATTPLQLLASLRDTFRPDEWLLLFCIGWFIVFVGLVTRRLTLTKAWFAVFFIGIMLCLVSAIAYWSEEASLYNEKNAVIVEQNVEVYSLPTKRSFDAGFSLNLGESVKIEEDIQDWIRIRKGKIEGWINKDKAEKIWPY
jgi:tetratricopeptide (TPR) repeat protein